MSANDPIADTGVLRHIALGGNHMSNPWARDRATFFLLGIRAWRTRSGHIGLRRNLCPADGAAHICRPMVRTSSRRSRLCVDCVDNCTERARQSAANTAASKARTKRASACGTCLVERYRNRAVGGAAGLWRARVSRNIIAGGDCFGAFPLPHAGNYCALVSAKSRLAQATDDAGYDPTVVARILSLATFIPRPPLPRHLPRAGDGLLADHCSSCARSAALWENSSSVVDRGACPRD